MDSLYLVGLAVLALFAFVLAIILFNFFGLWIRARIANAPVSLGKMVGMRLRKVPVGFIVDNRITAVKAGLPIASDPLEAHYLAGGSVDQVVLALIAADKAGISLDFNRACAIDLATKGTGKTVLEAVRTSINPKVIDAPSPDMGRATIDGVAQDGIGVKVKARVTVRSHLDRFVGGATEETIIARVGEGIVSAIGSAHSYKDVLENPDRISKTVLAKGLDSNTAFEILSIDIADVDVGDNIGAKLQTEQADADKRVAQAKAEVRRAAAVAVEQEMRAKTQEMRAKVVEAEALVPQAMADAFRSGNLGIMDYVRMKNVQADTSMRESIAGTEKPPRPIVPRTDIPPRPVAPVRPPPIPPARDVLTRRKRQIVEPTKYLAPAPTFEHHETPSAHELPASNKSPVEPYAIDTESKAKVGRVGTDIATLLRSPAGLRNAIVLREIFGLPRSLQSLDVVVSA